MKEKLRNWIKAKKKFKIIAVLIIVILIAGVIGGYVYLKEYKSIPRMGRINNVTEKVEKSSFINTITASGSVLLDDEIEVYAEGETNIIKKIMVEEGDTIKEGDLLVEYDVDDRKEELEKQIRDTKREIENAKLSMQSLETPADDTEINKLKSTVTAKEKSLQEAKANYDSYGTKLIQQHNTVDNAKKDVEDAEKELKDTEALLNVGGAAQSEYDSCAAVLDKAEKTFAEAKEQYNDMLRDADNAKLSITTAENDLKDAQNELADAQSPLSSEADKIKYKQQQITLQGLQDNLSEYEKDLNELVYTTTSNVDGKVTEVCVDEGTYTEENTVILKVADFNKLIVNASIEEYDAPLVGIGQKVVMTSDGLEGKEYTGTVTKVNDSAETASTNIGTETAVPVEISVDNPDGVLKPGYNLDLEITILDKQDVLNVSAGAVKTDGKSSKKYVFAVEGGNIIKREVTTGEENEASIEIVSGLSEGDEIIKLPNDSIQEGMSLDEAKELLIANTGSDEKSGSEKMDNNMMNGGMPNDQNRGSNKMLQSGGPGGGGFGGGRPMG